MMLAPSTPPTDEMKYRVQMMLAPGTPPAKEMAEEITWKD
jgi:hypothetical protein